MIYKNRLVLTNAMGVSHTLKAFSSVKISESETDPVKTATVDAQFIDNQHILEHHGINSNLEIYTRAENETQESLLFIGYVSNVPKVLEGNVKKYNFEAQDLLGKTKNILINEVFENMTPQDIVSYLLNNYTDFFTHKEIDIRVGYVSLQFKDEYLYDCLTKIAELTGTYFEVDIQKFSMKEKSNLLNPLTIRRNMFERGSGKFTDDSSQMVNHLRLYGGKELTPNFRTDVFNPNGTMKQFYTDYQPSQVDVFRDDVKMRVGIMYLHDDNNNYDVFMDYNNSLIEFVNPPARGQQVRIVYKYYQRIVVEETDQQSIEKYDYFMKTERVEHIIDRATLRQLAREKIKNNNTPKKVGNLKVFKNEWKAKEKVMIDIPELGVQEILTVTQKNISIEPNKLHIDLSFEKKPDLSTILKNHLNRIRELERKREEVESVDKYRTIEEKIEVVEGITVKYFDREHTFKIGLSKIGDAV